MRTVYKPIVKPVVSNFSVIVSATINIKFYLFIKQSRLYFRLIIWIQIY